MYSTSMLKRSFLHLDSENQTYIVNQIQGLLEKQKQAKDMQAYEDSLGTCEQVPPAYTLYGKTPEDPTYGQVKEEKAKAMYTTNEENKAMALNNVNASDIVIPDSLEVTQKKFLKSQAYKYVDEKIAELRKQFGLVDDERPMTAAEVVKRIQDGKYYLDPITKDYNTGWNPTDYIQWRDPSVMPDKAGFEAAKAKVDQLLEDASFAVMLQDNGAGEIAVKKIKDYTVQ